MAEGVLEENFTRDITLLITGWLIAMFVAGVGLVVFGNVIYG